MEARQLLKTLKDEGWYLGESVGPSRQYVHKDQPHLITVCVRYTDELGPETLASVRAPGDPAAGSGEGVVLEETPSGFSAYAPDVPGCVATGGSEAEVRDRLEEAITLHRAGLSGR